MKIISLAILIISFVRGVGDCIVKIYKLIEYDIWFKYCFKRIWVEMLIKKMRNEKIPDNYLWVRFNQLFNKRGGK